MNTIVQIVGLLSNPMFWVGLGVGLILLIGYYVLAAEVGSMDMPDANSTPEYRRKFKFWNIFAANMKRAAQVAHIPTATVVMDADKLKTFIPKGEDRENGR